MLVFHYHPDKAVKMGAGIDHVTVRRHNKCQKSTPKNIELQQWLSVSMIKPLMSSNDRDWLFIKEKLDDDLC
jgi:hypothetical protein